MMLNTEITAELAALRREHTYHLGSACYADESMHYYEELLTYHESKLEELDLMIDAYVATTNYMESL